MTLEKMKMEAMELIKKKDEEFGESWSDDTEEIANIMVEFRRLTTDKIFEIMERSTPNRCRYKKWEERVMELCE
jgi:hypothetical protein